MKIVQLVTHMHEIGGAQVHVRDISRRLSEEGHTVSIIYGGGKEATEDLKIDGVNYFFSKYLIRQIHVWKDLIAFIEVRRMLKDIQPDLVAIHSSKAGIIGRIGQLVRSNSMCVYGAWMGLYRRCRTEKTTII